MDLYKEYAVLKAEQHLLEDKISEVNKKIVEDMASRETSESDTVWGKFTIATKKRYEYSDKVADLEERVKLAKLDEQERGKAKVVESNYLVFSPKKDGEQ